jgi:GH24 family phage-related lysozyme (muramidase)
VPVALSAKGAAFIGAWEGFRSQPYNDSEGNATIGIGHLIHLGPVTAADREHWGTITRGHAYALAQADAHRLGVVPISENVHVDLTQAQKDALICLCFNTGPGALGVGHSVTLAVNSKPRRWNLLAMRAWHARVKAALLLWAHPAVLLRRRESEAALFATGQYRKPGNPYANS